MDTVFARDRLPWGSAPAPPLRQATLGLHILRFLWSGELARLPGRCIKCPGTPKLIRSPRCHLN